MTNGVRRLTRVNHIFGMLLFCDDVPIGIGVKVCHQKSSIHSIGSVLTRLDIIQVSIYDCNAVWVQFLESSGFWSIWVSSCCANSVLLSNIVQQTFDDAGALRTRRTKDNHTGNFGSIQVKPYRFKGLAVRMSEQPILELLRPSRKHDISRHVCIILSMLQVLAHLCHGGCRGKWKFGHLVW